jgi:NADPH:quinone reductase-like Zn-dependent oxidoreductase
VTSAPGGSLYPGLEASGVVEEVGQDVKGWKVGDEACALLVGGGYAEKVNVPAGQVRRCEELHSEAACANVYLFKENRL